ncbi:MAG: hypothetical protein OER77_10405, partial [Myxococcales bacterium]|nr:hypothetical protein [Myxococcales bacterium]
MTAGHRQSIWMVLMAWCLAVPANGQPPEVNADAGSPAVPVEAKDPEARAIEQLQEQTKQIQDLINGRLDVAVDPKTLFAVDLSVSQAGPDLELLLRELERGAEQSGRRTARKRVPRSAETESGLERARRGLIEARAAFLSLPPAKQEEILSKHTARRREATVEAASERVKTEMLIELQSQADQLEAFLQGELDPSIDPRPLLEIDFADLGEFASSSRRRKS